MNRSQNIWDLFPFIGWLHTHENNMLTLIHNFPGRASGKDSLNREWVKGRSEASLDACEVKDKIEKELTGIGNKEFRDSGV